MFSPHCYGQHEELRFIVPGRKLLSPTHLLINSVYINMTLILICEEDQNIIDTVTKVQQCILTYWVYELLISCAYECLLCESFVFLCEQYQTYLWFWLTCLSSDGCLCVIFMWGPVACYVAVLATVSIATAVAHVNQWETDSVIPCHTVVTARPVKCETRPFKILCTSNVIGFCDSEFNLVLCTYQQRF
jgi:hypothetical protein